MYNLGTLAIEIGDMESAGRWWESAAQSVHLGAKEALADLAKLSNDLSGALQWYSREATTDEDSCSGQEP